MATAGNIFTALADDTVIEDMKGNTYLFTHLDSTSSHGKNTDQPLDDTGPMDQRQYILRVISPTNSFFSVPPHYHPLTPETFRVFSGEVIATIGGIRRTLRPEDGEITVERGVVHSFESPEGVHTEFAEREDGAEVMKKKSYFLMSAVQLGMGGANPGVIQVFRLFWEDGDVFPSFGFRPLDKIAIQFIGGFLGYYLGLGAKQASKDQ